MHHGNHSSVRPSAWIARKAPNSKRHIWTGMGDADREKVHPRRNQALRFTRWLGGAMGA